MSHRERLHQCGDGVEVDFRMIGEDLHMLEWHNNRNKTNKCQETLHQCHSVSTDPAAGYFTENNI